MVIVLMGAAGADRTAIGRTLAAELGCTFVDADDLRPPASVASLHALAARALDRRSNLVMACSALDARDRRILRGDLYPVRFVCLKARETDRLAALEEPSADDVLPIDAALPPVRILAAIRAEFGV